MAKTQECDEASRAYEASIVSVIVLVFGMVELRVKQLSSSVWRQLLMVPSWDLLGRGPLLLGCSVFVACRGNRGPRYPLYMIGTPLPFSGLSAGLSRFGAWVSLSVLWPRHWPTLSLRCETFCCSHSNAWATWFGHSTVVVRQ